jgi:membrane peptidoglycan carboxypeptidase
MRQFNTARDITKSVQRSSTRRRNDIALPAFEVTQSIAHNKHPFTFNDYVLNLPRQFRIALIRIEAHPVRWGIRLGLSLAALVFIALWASWMRQGAQLARSHRAFEQTHQGWSFPAQIRATGERGQPEVIGWLIGPDAEVREHLPLKSAPKHLVDAIVAAEDRDFRSHHGVNVKAFIRALVANFRQGGYSQGASTLTMQVVRGLSQQKEKSVFRKLREAAMAMGLESAVGKDGVLEMYLDIPYLGQSGTLSVCGFSAASRYYFGKGPADLSVAEAATLAAILPSPGRFSPEHDASAARERRDIVLKAMALKSSSTTSAKRSPQKSSASQNHFGPVDSPRCFLPCAPSSRPRSDRS